MYSGRTLVRPDATVLPTTDITPGDWAAVTSKTDGLQSVNLRSEGFVLDGVTDETARFAALVSSVAAGTTIVLDERARLMLSTNVNISGKRLAIEGRGDATIVVSQKLSVPAISLANAEGCRITGITFEGAETSFDAVLNTQAFAFQLVNCPRSTVRDVKISKFSRGAFIANTDYVTVDDLSFKGMITGYATNSNYHSGLQLNNCDNGYVSNVKGTDVGNVVLLGGNCERVSIISPKGDNVYDAGVYISSGHYCTVIDSVMTTRADYTGNIGNGVSVKGTRNLVLGGTTTNMGMGCRMTGTGAMTDSGGYDGFGNRVIGHRAINCKVCGFQLGGSEGGPMKDGLIMGCYVEGGGEGYTNHLGVFIVSLGAIVLYGGTGNRVIANNVQNWTNTYSITFIGSGTGGVKNTTIAENFVRHFGTNSKSTAMFVDAADGVDILNNQFESISNTYAMRIGGGSTNTRISGNRRILGSGDVTLVGIRIEAGTSSIKIMYNPDMSVADDTGAALLVGNQTGGTANIPVSGSRGGNAALAALLTALDTAGIIKNNTTV